MRMKTKLTKFRIFIPVFLFSLLAAGGSADPAQNIDKSKILKEQFRIKKQLYPSTQPKIDQAVQAFQENFIASGEESNPVFLASQVAQDQFRTVSASQLNLLGFYVLCLATANLEEDINLIMAEIEKMNQVKEELNKLIADIEEQVQEKTEEEAQETEEETEEKETPVLKEYETKEVAPHFKGEYLKSPEFIYNKNLKEMNLSELNLDLYYVKTALNSVHRISKSAIEAMKREMDRRNIFLQELYYRSEDVANIDDSEIKIIR